MIFKKASLLRADYKIQYDKNSIKIYETNL